MIKWLRFREAMLTETPRTDDKDANTVKEILRTREEELKNA